jgi:hypothetical protein
MTTHKSEFGPQYAPDDDFKRRARLHQSRFRVQQLGLGEYREYGNRLAPADAVAGRNFHAWPGMLEAVANRFGARDKKIYFDMLASDHLPFNLFVPLVGHSATKGLVSDWTGVEVAEITALDFEWAPAPKSHYLDDNTSFDVYITYRTPSGEAGAVGVEVKYTEREYPWGTQERARMFSSASRYLAVHQASGLYKADSLERLRTPLFKQFWRNHLLGEAMLQRGSQGLARFTSVLLYPAGNKHFDAAARQYGDLLLPDRKPGAFRAMTYEAFIAYCRSCTKTPQHLAWTDYLTQRYIVD